MTKTSHLNHEILHIPSGRSYLAARGKVGCLYLPVITHGLPVTISLGCGRVRHGAVPSLASLEGIIQWFPGLGICVSFATLPSLFIQ